MVIGAGKASAAMARDLEDHWTVRADSPLEGLVVTRYGYAVPCRRIEIVQAAHPPRGSIKRLIHGLLSQG